MFIKGGNRMYLKMIVEELDRKENVVTPNHKEVSIMIAVRPKLQLDIVLENSKLVPVNNGDIEIAEGHIQTWEEEIEIYQRNNNGQFPKFNGC
jgi:hypothetical protein